MYKYLADSNLPGAVGLKSVVGPNSAHGDYIEGLISDDARRRRFRVNPGFLRKQGWSKVFRTIEKGRDAGLDVVQSYDGGLAELILFFRWARKIPSMVFLYNFHWASTWIEITKSRTPSAILLRTALRYSFRKKPSNLALTAETTRLGEILEMSLGIRTETYPIFTTVPWPPHSNWPGRAQDVLLFPARNSPRDLSYTASLASELAKRGVSIVTALSREDLEKFSAAPLTNHGPLNPVFTPLPQDSYIELFTGSRIVVLPYRAPYFDFGSSGKFNDAVAAGAFPMCFPRTAIASHVDLPSAHFISDSEPSVAASKILSRLQLGFDKKLRPVTLDQLIELLSREKVQLSRAAPFSSSRGTLLCLSAYAFRSRRKRRQTFHRRAAVGIWRFINNKIRRRLS